MLRNYVLIVPHKLHLYFIVLSFMENNKQGGEK